MTTLNASEVDVAVTGEIITYATTETAPVAISTELPVTAVNHGYASADGVVIETETSTTNITAWQNGDVVRTLITDASLTVNLTLLQSQSDDNLELYFGSEKQTDGSYNWDPAATGGRRSLEVWAIDTKNNKLYRIYFPEVEKTAQEGLTFVSTDAIQLGVTFTAYRSTDGYSAKVWVGDLPTGLDGAE